MTENTKSIWFKVKEIPLEIQKNKSESLCPRETTQNRKRAVDVMKFAQSLCHPDRKTKQNKKPTHNSLAKLIMSNDQQNVLFLGYTPGERLTFSQVA